LALKTFRDELILNPQAKRPFRKEALTWVALGRHSFILEAKGAAIGTAFEGEALTAPSILDNYKTWIGMAAPRRRDGAASQIKAARSGRPPTGTNFVCGREDSKSRGDRLRVDLLRRADCHNTPIGIGCLQSWAVVVAAPK
jgi:hypothetical protein